MIIKPGKSYIVSGSIALFAIIFLMIILMNKNLGFYSILPAGLGLSFIIIRGVIASGRTLIMTERGCTVHFWIYQKEYLWADLKVKRLENYKNSLGTKVTYNIKGAIFSPHNIHKPRWLMAAEYSALVHPFSFIYVYLLPKDEIAKFEGKKGYEMYMNYTVEENAFIEKLRSLGVTLEESEKK